MPECRQVCSCSHPHERANGPGDHHPATVPAGFVFLTIRVKERDHFTHTERGTQGTDDSLPRYHMVSG